MPAWRLRLIGFAQEAFRETRREQAPDLTRGEMLRYGIKLIDERLKLLDERSRPGANDSGPVGLTDENREQLLKRREGLLRELEDIEKTKARFQASQRTLER